MARSREWWSSWTLAWCVFTAESGFFAAAQLRQRIVRGQTQNQLQPFYRGGALVMPWTR